jgi:uncharacterized RDD family membrane protein YckC
MFCTRCGTLVAVSGKFCAQCGTPTESAHSRSPVLPARPQLQMPPFMRTLSYAPFLRRVGAHIIDTIVVYGCSFAALVLMTLVADIAAKEHSGPLMALTVVAVLSFQWWYYANAESSPLQATLGKQAVGLKVTDLNGTRISFGRASARFAAKLLNGLLLGSGFLLAPFTSKHQALHDLLAATVVINSRVETTR